MMATTLVELFQLMMKIIKKMNTTTIFVPISDYYRNLGNKISGNIYSDLL